MLSKDLSSGTITASQVPTAAQSYFTALYTNPDGKPVATGTAGPVTATYTANNGNMGTTIQLNGSGVDQHRLHEGAELEFQAR